MEMNLLCRFIPKGNYLKHSLATFLLTFFTINADAQMTLSLDSCRAMALRNNKQLNVKKLGMDVARDAKRAARTNYLPKIDIMGGYELFSKEISILNNDQKSALNNLGSNAMGNIGASAGGVLTNLAGNGVISPQTAQEIGQLLQHLGQPLAQAGDEVGHAITDAFRTDTRQMWAGSVLLRQPIFMGGAITAANKMADIAEQMAESQYNGNVQSTLYGIDETYWLVVSLKQKQKLAESYCNLIRKLDEDVYKLIREGIATKADGLKVDVKVNEAEMALSAVEDGLTLAKMLLCQKCGLPVDSEITLADEDSETIGSGDLIDLENTVAYTNRAEMQLLQNAVDMSRQATRLVRAAYLPHVALTGGYLISNPNVFNGFEKKFSGVWNVGVMVQMPLWNWLEGVYKVRAAKTATTIAELEQSDAREKIDLQLTQCRFKVREANKRLTMTTKNLANAEENLRCANVGFREGVMEATDVMAAQTAWQAARTQKIDAEINLKLSQVNLRKALGILE